MEQPGIRNSIDLLVESLVQQKFSPQKNRRSSLYDENELSDPSVLKVVIVGDLGVGKTTLFRGWTKTSRQVETTAEETNVGIEFASRELILRGQKQTCQLWDKG